MTPAPWPGFTQAARHESADRRDKTRAACVRFASHVALGAMAALVVVSFLQWIGWI